MTLELLKFVGTRKKVRIERSCPSEPRLSGFLLGASPALGLLHAFHDFLPDGYTVFRMEDVVEFRSGPYERHWESMLQAEGLTSGIDRVKPIDLTSMHTAIECISAQYPYLIVECETEDDDGSDDEFYIGSVVAMNFEILRFHKFDALGYWDNEPTEIWIEEITKLQFDTPYINTFTKYLHEGARPQHLREL